MRASCPECGRMNPHYIRDGATIEFTCRECGHEWEADLSPLIERLEEKERQRGRENDLD